MAILRSLFDVLVLLFFVTHIPITIFVDSQALFPQQWYPSWARGMMDNFLRDYKDPLMTPPVEPWLKSFIWSEVLLQLPFFFVGAFAFATRKNWIRIPAIIYGSFVCATMVPILTVLATHSAPGYKPVPLIAFYTPYLVMPALLVAVMAITPQPFSRRQGPKKGKRA